MTELSAEKTMTIKEISEALQVENSTVRKRIKELYPEKLEKGKTTYLNEYQATMIKKSLLDENRRVGFKSDVRTDLEKKLVIAEAMQIMNDEIAELRAVNEEMKPKALFYDTVTGSKDTIDMAKVAKVLNKNIGRNKLFNLLREKKILQNNNLPYQTFIDRGYFRVVESKYTKPDGSTHINLKTVVYQKGINYINGLLKG